MNKNLCFKSIFLVVLALFLILNLRPSGASLDLLIDQEIQELNIRIQLQKQQIESIQARQKEYEAQISAKRNEQLTLNNQLATIDQRLEKTELDIQETSLSIDKLNLEIRKVEIDSDNLQNKIELQKNNIAALIRLIYKQEQVSTLEALLLNNSLSDFLNQVKYLEDTNSKISESVQDLKRQKENLERNKLSLEDKNKEMKSLRAKLEQRKDNLVYEQDQKTNILEQTKMSEKAFQDLLAKARAEQNAAQADIARSETLIRQKMSQKDRQKLEDGDSAMSWPVTKNVITSTFHDPSYPYRKIIGEHSGIDIRAAQGSTLYAAADGYVARVKFDGSRDYAYIMIIHADNLATVYGHISAVSVAVDDYVVRGQVIGKTGGMPGTAGAGSFSTGPHLHFEVRKNGLPVNPLNYLP